MRPITLQEAYVRQGELKVVESGNGWEESLDRALESLDRKLHRVSVFCLFYCVFVCVRGAEEGPKCAGCTLFERHYCTDRSATARPAVRQAAAQEDGLPPPVMTPWHVAAIAVAVAVA